MPSPTTIERVVLQCLLISLLSSICLAWSTGQNYATSNEEYQDDTWERQRWAQLHTDETTIANPLQSTSTTRGRARALVSSSGSTGAVMDAACLSRLLKRLQGSCSVNGNSTDVLANLTNQTQNMGDILISSLGECLDVEVQPIRPLRVLIPAGARSLLLVLRKELEEAVGLPVSMDSKSFQACINGWRHYCMPMPMVLLTIRMHAAVVFINGEGFDSMHCMESIGRSPVSIMVRLWCIRCMYGTARDCIMSVTYY